MARLVANGMLAGVPITVFAQAAPPARPPGPEISGVLYANAQYGGGVSDRASNRFDLERAYLTFRAPAGDRGSIRVTADVFQQTSDASNAFYRGWVVRAKYAYGQYDYLAGDHTPGGLLANVRLGILQTVMVDHAESFWPRWISQTATERSGFFSSADVGIASTLTLPKHRGEVYATIVNGNSYTSRETDRFKDYAARVTLTPLANRATGLFRTITISPWYSSGTRASDFVAGKGTVRPVVAGRRRDRWGLFAATRDPRLSLTADIASTRNVVETADTLAALTPTARETSGRLLSASLQARPLSWFRASTSTFGIIARVDRFKPDAAAADQVHFTIAGLTWAMTPKISVALDYQVQSRDPYQRASDTKVVFLHAAASW
jgi:hypothetical protein